MSLYWALVYDVRLGSVLSAKTRHDCSEGVQSHVQTHLTYIDMLVYSSWGIHRHVCYCATS